MPNSQDRLSFFCVTDLQLYACTVGLGNKDLFGCPKIVSYLTQKFPYPYEVNGKLVTGNSSLLPICSLSNRSLLPSLTVQL